LRPTAFAAFAAVISARRRGFPPATADVFDDELDVLDYACARHTTFV
jgi:hypothetical protein